MEKEGVARGVAREISSGYFISRPTDRPTDDYLVREKPRNANGGHYITTDGDVLLWKNVSTPSRLAIENSEIVEKLRMFNRNVKSVISGNVRACAHINEMRPRYL